jgi:hypothetical protein
MLDVARSRLFTIVASALVLGLAIESLLEMEEAPDGGTARGLVASQRPLESTEGYAEAPV